jgi:hypothetical protein
MSGPESVIPRYVELLVSGPAISFQPRVVRKDIVIGKI